MSNVVVNSELLGKLLDYGLAGIILYYLGNKIDKLQAAIEAMSDKLSSLK